MAIPFRLSLLFALLVLTSIAAGAESSSYVYTVKGRVVDDKGRPVAGATVVLKSPSYAEGDIVYLDSSDSSGRFVVSKRSVRMIQDWKLWISDDSAVPRDTNQPIGWDSTFCSDLNRKLCGTSVFVQPNKITNLGDVRLNIQQVPVLFKLIDQLGNPLVKSGSGGLNPWWIIRDPLGNMVAETGNAYIHFRFDDSGVMTALPTGHWKVEIVDWGDSNLSGIMDLEIQPSAKVQQVEFKLRQVPFPTFSGTKLPSAEMKNAALRKLKSLGLKLGKSDLKRAVIRANEELVELFLQSGLDANVLTDNEDTLTSSISHPRLLKLLLEAGADPNRKIRDGITPLLYACGWLVIPKGTVEMLLDAGADLFVKASDGRDVFVLAEERQEILLLLNEHQKQRKKQKN